MFCYKWMLEISTFIVYILIRKKKQMTPTERPPTDSKPAANHNDATATAQSSNSESTNGGHAEATAGAHKHV